MPDTIGIIGLGRMGIAAAKRYMKSGYEVVGCDINPDAVKEFIALGGIAVQSAKEAAQKARIIIIYVLNDQQVINVVEGKDGILEGGRRETKVICMATIDIENLKMLAAKCTERGIDFADSPVTGGPARVEAGTVTIILACPKSLLDECRSILEVQGQITYIGEKHGMGQAVKHCNQLLVATTLAATGELIVLARKGGVDPKLVCQVVGNGICGSDYFRLVASSILEDTPSPGGLGQMCKDIGLVVNDGKNAQVPLIVASAAYQYFLSALSLGMEAADSSELIKILEKMTNKQ